MNRQLLLFVISLGILLRLIVYLQQHSLWTDEVYLSNSIVHYNWSDIFSKPLLYYQKAPLGFLALQKLMVSIFPANELSLRFVSLSVSILTIFLLVPVFTYFLNGRLVALALALFALSPPLIHHACEAKQYATELFAATAALWLYIWLKNNPSVKSQLGAAIAGSLLVWCSYSVIFILAAVSAGLLLQQLRVKNLRRMFFYGVPVIFWLCSFLLNFYFFTRHHAKSEWTVYWFDYYNHFAPLPPQNIDELTWYPLRFYRLLNYPLGLLWNFMYGGGSAWAPVLKMAPVLLGFMVLGVAAFWKRKTDLIVLMAAVALTLLASGLKLYPLTERFWVFLSTIFLILIVRGCAFSIEKMPGLRIAVPCFLLVGATVNLLLLFTPVQDPVKEKRSAQRQVLEYIEREQRSGDQVYIYWNDLPGYRLYRKLYPFTFSAREGKDYRKTSVGFNDYMQQLEADMNAKPTQRVWMVVNVQFQSDIGEPVDWPEWYFKGQEKPTDRVIKELSKKMKVVQKYKMFDMEAYCFSH